MKFLFSSTVLSLLLVDPSSSIAAESSAAASESSNQHLHDSVSIASEDIASSVRDVTTPDVLRVLKKKKKRKKNPKSGNKESKSAKGSSATLSPSPQPSPQESSQPSLSSQPTDPCASISTPADALLALKAGFRNGDTVLSEWSSDTEPCNGNTSNWGGLIVCFNGQILVGLYSAGLEGTISPLIACPTTLVTSLEQFDVGENKLSGTIPKELAAFTSLTYLGFGKDDDSLSGTMPSEICALRDTANPPGLLEYLCDASATPKVVCDCCACP